MNADPLLTVIIPTYNRCKVVLTCLRALRAQTLGPETFEIVVIDDGSSDETDVAVRAETAGWGGRLTYLRQENSGANTARNRGIAASRGSLLVIINDDSIAVPDFLAEHLRIHRENPGEEVAVLGRMTASPDLPWSPVTELHLDDSYRALAGKTELDWKAFFTCNVSVKKSFLERCGNFEPSLRWHEDVELGERLRHHGLRVLYNPAALAYHLHYLSEEAFLRIGEKEGAALALWYLRDPSLIDTLVEIGLRTRSFPVASPRYRLADMLINDLTFRIWRGAARALSAIGAPAAHSIYRALFQARKRQAIAKGLAPVLAGGAGPKPFGIPRSSGLPGGSGPC